MRAIGEKMKKLLILTSILLISNNINCGIWDSIKNAAGKVGGAIEKGAAAVGKEAKNLAGQVKDIAQNIGDQVVSCSQLAGYGTGWAASKAGLGVAQAAVSAAQHGTDYAAFESSKLALKTTQDTAKGVLTLADAFAEGVQKGFNIECIRFLGAIEGLEFELDAHLFGQTIKIREKVDFTNVEQFAKKIFNILKDKASQITNKFK